MRRAWLVAWVAALHADLATLACAGVGADGCRHRRAKCESRATSASSVRRSRAIWRCGRATAITPEALDQSLKNLFATGLFDGRQGEPRRQRLVVTVVENPIINRIAFEGNSRLDDKTLEAEIQLRPRVVFTRSRVQNAVTRILELYRRNGRYGASRRAQGDRARPEPGRPRVRDRRGAGDQGRRASPSSATTRSATARCAA